MTSDFFPVVKCPFCEESIPMAGNFCPKCARKLTEICKQCGERKFKGQKFCKKEVFTILREWRQVKEMIIFPSCLLFIFPYGGLIFIFVYALISIDKKAPGYFVILATLVIIMLGLLVLMGQMLNKKIKKAFDEFCKDNPYYGTVAKYLFVLNFQISVNCSKNYFANITILPH